MMLKEGIQDCSTGWSGKYDSLSLSARLKLLRSMKQTSDSVYFEETIARGQCEYLNRSSNSDGGENSCFSSEEENMLPGQDHEDISQPSDCSLNDQSSPSSAGFCVVSHGDGSYERVCTPSSISSSEFLCNDRSPDSSLAVSKLQHPALSDISPRAQSEYEDASRTMSSDSAYSQGPNAKHEISCDFDGDLESIVLSERRRMLLSRLLVKSQMPCIQVQACSVEMPKSCLSSGDEVQHTVLTITEDSNGDPLIAGNLHDGNIDHDLALKTSKSDTTGTFCTLNHSSAPPSDNHHIAESVESQFSTPSDSKPGDTQDILRSKVFPSSIQVKSGTYVDFDDWGKISAEFDDWRKYVSENFTRGVVPVKKEMRVIIGAAENDSDHLPSTDQLEESRTRTRNLNVSRDLYQNKTVPSTVKLGIDISELVKLSTPESNDRPSSLMKHNPSDRQEKATNQPRAVSSFPPAIPIKIEPVVSNEIENDGKFVSTNLTSVKNEVTISAEASEDELDHMSLLDRLMLLSSETSPGSKASKNLKDPTINASSFPGLGRGVLKSSESITVNRPRKRRRTATNCPETALEEDVPGLLKVLIEKGVLVEEIKLYGEPESDEAIDESFCENSFSELEDVIQKVFSRKESLLKMTPICSSKNSKVTYCLGCLFSLIEQARYLRTQNCPVEWGWSRDLQAFIFVFERHNRIVLERPEYGYATYFFGLLESLPVGWQIRRLVTAMKLTNCGRISLLENRPLMVGEDVSEGEARVLSQYGWVPDTGLATMLNYCGRVIHDTNKERDGNEWKQKIAKMLIDGFNGGILVPQFLLKKEEPVENESESSQEVKMEI